MATDTITARRLAVPCGLLGRQHAASRTATPPPPAVVAQPGTVVVQEGSASNAQQLTIFYGGMVVVLDSCTPEKAAELLRLAATAAGQGAPKLTPTLVDIPVARNASLRRFLSKRKDRATAPDPAPLLDFEPVRFQRMYDEPEPAAKKGKLEVSREEAASWLALGSLGTMHAP